MPKGDWQADDVGWLVYTGFTPPDTATELVWEDYFPTNFQCVVWQARVKLEAIPPGETLVSLRYLIGEGAKRNDPGPLPYVAVGDDGQVLGSGMTVPAGTVPAEGASFGRVKQLYAR